MKERDEFPTEYSEEEQIRRGAFGDEAFDADEDPGEEANGAVEAADDKPYDVEDDSDAEPYDEDVELIWKKDDPNDLRWEAEDDRRKLYNEHRVREEDPEEPDVPSDRTGRLAFLREQTRKVEEVRNSSVTKMREKERRRDRLRAFLVIAALVASFAAAGLLYYHNYRFTTYSVDQELSLGAIGRTKLYAFRDGSVVLGGDTVLYVENEKILWSALINVENPIYAAKGNYFAIANRGGYELYICDAGGMLSTIRVSRKIRCLDISSAGVVAVSTESSDSSYVSYFDRFGTKISVEVKTVLDVSGYPMHLSISPDGQKLLVVYYCMQNGIGESRIAVYDFQNGKQDKSYVVASFEDFYNTDTYLVESRFFDDRHAVVVGDNELVFLSDFTKGNVVRTTVKLTDPIRSVVFTDTFLLLVQDEMDHAECRIYDMNGEVMSSFVCPDVYDNVVASADYVLFTDKADIRLYNVSGVERYEGSLTFAPQAAAFQNRKSLFFSTGSKFQKITLK